MTDTRIVSAPGIRPLFQVAAGDVEQLVGQARYDVSRYVGPDATYSGLDAAWTDDPCDVIDATTFYGRQRSIDVFDVGRATCRVRNPAGMWDYPPVDPATPLTIRPGRQARVGVSIDGNRPVWLWHGWIDVTTPDYYPVADRDVVTVDCIDAKGEFGRVELAAVATPVGAGESVTARMTRLANGAEFPAHRRQFANDPTTLLETSLGGRAGALADSAVSSAGGDLFGDANGFLRLVGADWQTRGPGEPFDAYIGNRGIDGEVCPQLWEVAFARSDFSNRVIYGRSGEEPATINDLVNQGRYGIETWSMTSLETSDNAAMLQVAQRALRVRNFDRAPRIAAVTLNAAHEGAADLMSKVTPWGPWYVSCGLVQGDRAVFARAMYVTGVEHTITAGQWTCRLQLDDAAPFATVSNARYDTARYNQDEYSKAV